MDVKVVRQGENLAIVVPKEFAGIKEGDRLELVEVKPGIYTLVNTEVLVKAPAAPTGPKPAAAQEAPLLSPNELRVLKKLDAIKYEQRIPSRVQKLLSEEEGRILDGMVRKGFVSIYRGKQYSQSGVYSIANTVYGLLRKGPETPLKPEQVSEKSRMPWDEHLGKYGYVIIENENEAKPPSRVVE